MASRPGGGLHCLKFVPKVEVGAMCRGCTLLGAVPPTVLFRDSGALVPGGFFCVSFSPSQEFHIFIHVCISSFHLEKRKN